MTDRRVSLVTGASRGIGRAIAARFRHEGHFVVGTATSESGAAAISDCLGDDGAGVCLRIDDDDSVAQALALIVENFGAPAILVNNAGVTRDNLLMRMSAEEWQSVIGTNLTGLYRICKPLIRPMIKARWGRIVSLSSVVGTMGNAGQSNYAASKAGIEGFTRSLAQEIGSRGITVNAVAPGFIETDMTAALNDDQTDAMKSRIPLGRLGAVEDVASVVAFLVSDAAAYITGETINVNGGLYMG